MLYHCEKLEINLFVFSSSEDVKELLCKLIVGIIVDVDNNVVGEDYEKLAKELENASPLQIMKKALDKFGNDIAIAFR